MAEPFVKTVQKVDAILYHLGYKDGKDYKWSDRDHVLTFTSDEVRKAVATKIPSELIHAQYPKTIELEDKGFTDSRSVYRVKDTNGLIHRVVARNSDEAVKKVKDALSINHDKVPVLTLNLMPSTYHEEFTASIRIDKYDTTISKGDSTGVLNILRNKLPSRYKPSFKGSDELKINAGLLTYNTELNKNSSLLEIENFRKFVSELTGILRTIDLNGKRPTVNTSYKGSSLYDNTKIVVEWR